MKFVVYILKSEKTDKFYVGHTEDFSRRLLEHNSGKSKSTKSGIPWELISMEEFDTRTDAIKKEMQIKKRGIKRYLKQSAIF
ncbi:MAG: GIY-YIG nuclease family protein [Bacteroidota bacterium]